MEGTTFSVRGNCASATKDATQGSYPSLESTGSATEVKAMMQQDDGPGDRPTWLILTVLIGAFVVLVALRVGYSFVF